MAKINLRLKGAPRMVSAREIVGKTIVAFDPGTWRDIDPEHKARHTPSITLDDGSVLVFVTEESECLEYGTLIKRVIPK